MYGKANGNSREAQRLYQEAFPGTPPCEWTFTSLHQILCKTGTFSVNKGDCGRNQWKSVLEVGAANSGTSTRRIATQDDVPNNT
ncbi:unnamed protein product [Brassicogethes aeneus]|uniref:DUF4817 domain-containing protein n=1 Tax=Brassicogethes aeneus TaxID=1431903 RepID=A0A9P0B3N6_BRAAE|nr:unnamed protein product [Brassicogethes aeneus]